MPRGSNSNSRCAYHAGSWYTDDGNELNRQLSDWLSKASSTPNTDVGAAARAVIAPHAGYLYCGACAAFAYKHIEPSTTKRVFILGPSHHVRLAGCALSSVMRYETPLYPLNIDAQIYSELQAEGAFERMSVSTDEDEHSIEMHLPYVAKVMENFRDQFTIVPVLVGGLSVTKERQYGQIFAKYLEDPSNVFVISSDFCHWGSRFNYKYVDDNFKSIWQSIEHLDRQGMNTIESLDPAEFSGYLQKYGNTICGRHPIGVLLNAIETIKSHGSNGTRMALKFVQYAQSSKCHKPSDSSVSYASAVFTLERR